MCNPKNMKNLKLVLAAAVVIFALSACQKANLPKPEEQGPPVLPPAAENPDVGRPNIDIGALCTAAKGTWSAEWLECGGVDKTWCEANGGVFEECGSACRHDPKAELCTMQCVIFCRFGPEAPKLEAKLPTDNGGQGNSVPGSPGLVGGDKDAHGCIGSAGYSWCEAKSKCLRIWEEPCWPEATDAIKQAFADKYKKPLDQIRVTVGEADEAHAKGGVGFSMNGAFGEGGNFLAAKVDGKWEIIFDGNGGVACSTLEPYKFPASMIDGFCAK
jgi:hypothetical protein